MTRRAALWIILALLGIVATVAVAWFASRLAVQRIGLSSEPLSVATGLAPRPAKASAHLAPRARRPRGNGGSSEPAAAPTKLPSSSAAPPSQPGAPVTPAPVTTSQTPPAAPAPPAPTGRDGQGRGGQSGDSNSGPDD